MAKKKEQRPNGPFNNTSKIDTDLFIKGMIKDSHESFVGQENWVHARNAINNSVSGDAGTIGNEPANLSCANANYTIIGAVYLFGDKWIIYSTDNTSSEIGLFDDSQCQYDILINDSCLNFNKFNLITGASKENFDCSWQVYWDDGKNPSRTLNIGPADKITENMNVPWKQAQVPGTGTDGNPCIEYVNLLPLQLNCDLIRLAPFMDTPKITLSKADSPGQLKNGSYQAYIAYTVNEQQIGDYIGVSNIQPLFDGDDTASSLDVSIENLDTNFDFYKLVLMMNNQQQTQAIQVGLYSTNQKEINIDYINPNTANASQVPISTLPLRTPVYERSNQMVVLNDYLMRIGPTTQFDFNYQLQANNITARWVSVEYPATYYKNGGNKPSFMRDEQYSFFIRFVYATGDKSNSYHIPGRAYLDDNPDFGDEKGGADGNNALNIDEDELWQTTNTAFLEETDGVTVTDDGGIILSKGQMGYWESTERYPAEDTENRWGDLCGQNIRHHKFPEEQTDISTLNRSSADNQNIRVLGVEFDNITWPLFNPDQDGNTERIPNIVGYEILVGSRQGNKSILSKGIIRNMRSYAIPADGNSGADTDGSTVGLMPNYPFNDWGPDPYLSTQAPDGTNKDGTEHPSNPHICGNSETYGTCLNFYTFHSPETSFNRPYLNPSEIKSYGLTQGLQQGHFKPSEGHPKNVLIRDFAAIIAVLIGCAYAMGKLRGKSTRQLHTPTDASFGAPSVAAGATIGLADTALTAASIVPPGPGIGEETFMSGTTATIAAASSALTLASGQLGPKRVVEFEGTDWKSGPNAIYGVLSIFGFINYVVDGGQVVIDLIYNAAGVNQHAYKYNSYGLYSQTVPRHDGDVFRVNTNKARYVGNVIQDFGSSDIALNTRVNNLFRPATVVLQSIGNQGGNMLSGIPADLSKTTLGDQGIGALSAPTRGSFRSNISAHYVGLKFAMDNQYGQLDGIKQIPIPSPQSWLDELGEEVTNLTTFNDQTFKSEPLFGGDVYINRYNEKVIMPFFWQFLNGEPDEFGFQYQNYMNAPYAKYYMDTTKYDLINMVSPIFDFSFDWGDGGLPSTLHNMDRDATGGGAEIGNIAGGESVWESSGFLGGTNNNFFVLKRAYMYTHCSGVNDFFVESELNVGLRAQGGGQKEKFYDWTEYTSLNDLFHADIIKEGNYYKYDASLSKYNLTSQMISHGVIQPRDYDPFVAETCYDYYPKRILYSNQAFKEAKKDFWRIYLPNNYQDFKNAPTTIKPISKSGALILFPHLAPLTFQGVDTLTTDYNTKLVIGDGGLFNDPMQQISTADLPHEYGSCENSRSVINTPSGVFFVSQAQGKIFNYGEGLKNIADAGLKQWFNSYLPSRLIAAYPEIEGTAFADNPVMGVGVQAVYDPNYDIVYFCKRDFEPCNVDECIEFDPELPGFIINETTCNGVTPTVECPEGYTLNCEDPEDIETCECCDELGCPEGTTLNEDGECCTTEYGEPVITEEDSDNYFEPVDTITSYTKNINNTSTFRISKKLFDTVNKTKPKKIDLEIPFLNNKKVLLKLEKFSTFAKDFEILETKKGETNSIEYKSKLVTYKVRGTSKKDKWRGTISFIGNSLNGVIRKNNTAYEFSKTRDNQYAIYNADDAIEKSNFICAVDDTSRNISDQENLKRNMRSWTVNDDGTVDPPTTPNPEDYVGRALCVTIASQIDYYTYNQAINNSGMSVDDLFDWVASIIATVNEIYEEELNVSLIFGTGHYFADLTNEPYSDINSDNSLDEMEAAEECLYTLRDEWNGDGTSDATIILADIPRTVAILFSTRRFGSVAYLDKLCNQSLAYAACMKLSFTPNLTSDTYTYSNGGSWTMKVLAHELGHIFGGQHTHYCIHEPDADLNFDGDGNGGPGAIDNANGAFQEPPYSEGCYDEEPWFVSGEVNLNTANDEDGNLIDYVTIMSYGQNPIAYNQNFGNTDNPVTMPFKFHSVIKKQLLYPAIENAQANSCAACPQIEECSNPSQLTEEWVQENINDVYDIGWNLTEYCMWCSGSLQTSPVDNAWGCPCCADEPRPIPGCMDPEALNYNPEATIDDGSCIYCIYGCMDSNALNYDPQATCTDNSCEYPIADCTDPLASNYNPEATEPCTLQVGDSIEINGCCIYPVSGCTDPEAFNYDPEATISCPDNNEDGLPDCCNYPSVPPVLECECEQGYTMVYAGTTNEVPLDIQSETCLNPAIDVECILQICEDIVECIDPIIVDVITEINLEQSEYFTDISWTVSYDPKIKGWISFHDWHPELTLSSHKHFLTTKTIGLDEPYCPPGYTFDQVTGRCENDGLSCFPGYELQDDEVTCCGNVFSGVVAEEYIVDPEDSEFATEVINPSFEIGFPNPFAEDPTALFPQWEINDGIFTDWNVGPPYGIGVYTPLPWYRCMITDVPPKACLCTDDELPGCEAEPCQTFLDLFGIPENQVDDSECDNPPCYESVSCCSDDDNSVNNGQSQLDTFWTPPVLSQTPDTLPAQWLNSPISPAPDIIVGEYTWGQTCGASEGNNYMGMVHACASINPNIANWAEGLSQELSQPFQAGTEYTASIDARDHIRTWAVLIDGTLLNDCEYDEETSSPLLGSSVVIFGCYNACCYDTTTSGGWDGKVLYHSGVVGSEPFGAGCAISGNNYSENCDWTTLNFTFTPEEAFSHILIRIESENYSRYQIDFDGNEYDVYHHPNYKPNSIIAPHFYDDDGNIIDPGNIPQGEDLLMSACGGLHPKFQCGNVSADQTVNGADTPNFGVSVPCYWCRNTGMNTCNTDCNCAGAGINGPNCWGSNLTVCTQSMVFDQFVCPRYPGTPSCNSGGYWNGLAPWNAANANDLRNSGTGTYNFGTPLPNGNIFTFYELYDPTSILHYNMGNTLGTPDEFDEFGNRQGWVTDEDGFPVPDCYQRTGYWYCCDRCYDGGTECCKQPVSNGSNQCRELVFSCVGGGTSAYLNVDNLTAFTPTAEETGFRCGCTDPDATMVFVNVNDTQTVIEGMTPSEDDCVNQEINSVYYEGEYVVTCVKEDCYNLEDDWTEPSYESSGIWKHNVRCDLFNNYYTIQYPWEIELIESIGQEVNTIRSVEYQLEAYEYKPQYDDAGCMINYGCDDRWHDLMYNFDEAIVYNSEQNSGLLTLVEQTPDVNDIVSYPIIGTSDTQILFKKVEQKYRFDQFWDNTDNRNVSQSMFITQLNGYIKDLNDAYLNYNKPQLQRKKFRHYVNNLILRKKVIYEQQLGDSIFVYPDGMQHTRKMILKLVNTKLNLSHR